MEWKLFFTTFGAIFLAELGDKTQLACIFMAANTGKTWTVFAGTSAALVVVSLIGVLLANVICNYLPVQYIRYAAGAGFVIIGGLMLWGKI